MEVFGHGPDAVLIVGGLHGNEPSGAAVARELASYLRNHPECLIGRTVGILAEANPDGLARATRANARGVDLNRNFPSRSWRPALNGELPHGPHPASEPEARAVMTAIEIVKPARIVDIHSIGGARHCNNYDGLAEQLARRMSHLNDYPVSTDIGYATPGALGCWAGIDLGIPAITLELPRGLSPGQCWRDNAAALLAVIEVGDQRLARETSVQAGSP
jgi:protein MpaA